MTSTGSATFPSRNGCELQSVVGIPEPAHHPIAVAKDGIAPDPDAVSARHWVALLGAMLGAFMAVLDIQITNASLNDILGSLGATLEEGSWVSTSYLVAEIIVIP